MFGRYVVVGICAVWLVGCTGKDTIPPMPPKSEKTQLEESRTLADMQSKLERIRNPIEGENISEQKRDARDEIDTLLGDAQSYKGKVSRFEKAQLSALKNAKKSYKHKLKKHRKKQAKAIVVYKKNKDTIDMVNEYENKLKYY